MGAASTYRAMHAVSPGRLELTEKKFQPPGPGKVRIRVEACGVCHSDSGTVGALFPIEWPRVPGHELVGRIVALGPGVQGWAVGQRAGVGFLGGSCCYCGFCRSGDLVFASRKLEGALTGDPATADATLRFSALSGVSAMIETVPLERAADAYAKIWPARRAFASF